ncbi:hypothetical protein CLU79DRAFT_763882 [Phycomyces nitens]|nr:hypothetical protein CLU79DRAFT_763882 [Phycomyces nitens]
MAGKGMVRSIKNYAKGFSEVQRKVRESTSNDPWGPSGTSMNEIAQLTFNKQDFLEIMDMIDKRMNDKGKHWRHVFKALLLLDYCIHVGSENVVIYSKGNLYVIKTLGEFQHIDEQGKDVGANVRQKAKDITSLLQDDVRLHEERRQRRQMRDRMAGVNDYLGETMNHGQMRIEYSKEDQDLQTAIEESKRLAEEEERKRQSSQAQENKPKESDPDDVWSSIFGPQQQPSPGHQLPSTQASFDDLFKPSAQQTEQKPSTWPQTTGFPGSFDGLYTPSNNPYQPQPQQQLGDWSGFNNNHNALQAQMTGVPPSPFQMSPPVPQSMFSVGVSTNPFTQMDGQGLPQPIQSTVGSQSPYLLGVSSGIKPVSPSLSPVFAARALSLSPFEKEAQSPCLPADSRYANLNALLTRDDGMDTFGNTGSLRVPQ